MIPRGSGRASPRPRRRARRAAGRRNGRAAAGAEGQAEALGLTMHVVRPSRRSADRGDASGVPPMADEKAEAGDALLGPARLGFRLADIELLLDAPLAIRRIIIR